MGRDFVHDINEADPPPVAERIFAGAKTGGRGQSRRINGIEKLARYLRDRAKQKFMACPAMSAFAGEVAVGSVFETQPANAAA
jgi:hypothetical protein